MSLTRTTRFEVVFPSLRKADQEAHFKKIWGLMDDLTRATTSASTPLV